MSARCKLNHHRPELKILDDMRKGVELKPVHSIERISLSLNELKLEILTCAECRKMIGRGELCSHHEELFLYEAESGLFSDRPKPKVLYSRAQKILEI